MFEPIFKEIKDIIDEKQEADSKLKFNIFSAISDVFYKENFHSDILFMFLQQKEIYVSLFKRLKIKNVQDGSVEVVKEYPTFTAEKRGRIDILIKYKDDKQEQHCIIIENKINNAVDQERQLWRYYDYCRRGMTVDTIIYLTLLKEKEPDFGDCSEEEKKEIKERLLKIVATEFVGIISENREMLDENILSALIQYKNLIAYLNGDTTMDANDKIYNIIKNKDGNYKVLKQFYEVFDKFPEYIAKKVYNHVDYYLINHNIKDLTHLTKVQYFGKSIAFDTEELSKIKDVDTDDKVRYCFRLEYKFFHDCYEINFRYYGYTKEDDNKLGKYVGDEDNVINQIITSYNEKKIKMQKNRNNYDISATCQYVGPDFIENLKNKFPWEDLKKVDSYIGNYIEEIK